MQTESHWPSITCTTPTYGRFSRLRDAIACFLLQDYEGRKHLEISNDAAVPITLTPDGNFLEVDSETTILLVNWPERFVNLGRKRQQMVDAVGTDLVAHWDDDDLYLPWHLSARVGTLMLCPEVDCAKPVMAWWVEGPPDKYERVHWQRKGYDGQMVFRTETQANYLDGTRSVPAALVRDYVARGKMHRSMPSPQDTTYVYRLNDDMRHLCKTGRNEARAKRLFARTNRDFGDGEPLLPPDGHLAWARDQMRHQFHQLIAGWKVASRITPEDVKVLSNRLLTALGEG